MITSRMLKVEADQSYKHSSTKPQQPKPDPKPEPDPKLPVTIYKKEQTEFGSVMKTVSFEAVFEKTGAVLRSESHRVMATPGSSATLSKLNDFAKLLREDGYTVTIDGERR